MTTKQKIKRWNHIQALKNKEQKTFTDIGKVFAISRQRAQQIYASSPHRFDPIPPIKGETKHIFWNGIKKTIVLHY
jgi:hypothetical protein